VRPLGTKRSKLRASGKVKVKVQVAFTPSGGDPAVKKRALKLRYKG